MRRRLVLIAAASVAVALSLLTAGLYFVLSYQLERDSDAVLRSRAAAVLATISGSGQDLQVSEGSLDEAIDNGAWVFDSAGREVERPRVSSHLDRAARSLAGVDRDTYRNAGGQTRLFAVPARSGGARLGTVVVSVSQVPYEHTEQIALITALLLDTVIVAMVAVVAHRVVTASLRPVVAMTEQALDWSEHEIDQRFAVGAPRDELTKLANALDVLLDRLAANLRYERRLSAEIAHELKTPLARLRGEAELALRRERSAPELRRVLDRVVSETDQLSGVVDTLLAVSQKAFDPSVRACYAGAAAAAAIAVAAERSDHVELDLRPPSPDLRVGCDAETLGQILAPLLNNAAAYAASRVTVTVVRDDGFVMFEIRDDGPGVAETETDSIFAPGVRGTAGEHRPGFGLGLTLSRRLARASSGDVVARPGPGGVFNLRLPSA